MSGLGLANLSGLCVLDGPVITWTHEGVGNISCSFFLWLELDIGMSLGHKLVWRMLNNSNNW